MLLTSANSSSIFFGLTFPSSSAITNIFLYAASCFWRSYSTPTSRNTQPSPIKNIVPPSVQTNAPVINPYCQSPKKKIGIPIDNPNSIGINCISIITASIRLVPSDSIIRENLTVSSCTLCDAPSIFRALS